MDIFSQNDLVMRHQASGAAYLEFLRVPTLSAGLYCLPVGGVDGQSPHTEDEIYIVLRGQAVIQVAEQEHAVSAGSVVFVGAGVPHRFHTITDALQVLVVFAPAEYSQRQEKA